MAVLEIRNGFPQVEAVSGKRRISRPDPVKVGDRWNLGSDGKAMTATMVARLVEEGKLRWDTPLAQLLPELAADMQPQYRDVTLLELLSHRAGLPENHDDLPYFYTFLDDKRPLPTQRLDYLHKAVADAPIAPARGEMHYSNTGLILAAAVAERAAGKPFEQLMYEEVFGPLGMKSATFAQPVKPNEPVGHVDGRVADQPKDSNPQMFMPAGGVRMSIADWARFCIDQMNGDQGHGKLLKPETYRLLHTGQGATHSALGWGVAATPLGRQGPALTHNGSDGNWYAIVVLFPKTGNGLLVAANAADSMGGDKATLAVARELIEDLAPPKLTEPAPAL
ncbi:beta-lactamase family protein [Sphingomonas sp. RB56-2]|uniref:Beta-lactamase family protein n=2 Tax=Sphingomonas brevis TaxID=2908206 RepID=A0ABT0SAN0_9SPHN|nr:beta-lactamase family protein [Sphingomonas brevis]